VRDGEVSPQVLGTNAPLAGDDQPPAGERAQTEQRDQIVGDRVEPVALGWDQGGLQPVARQRADRPEHLRRIVMRDRRDDGHARVVEEQGQPRHVHVEKRESPQPRELIPRDHYLFARHQSGRETDAEDLGQGTLFVVERAESRARRPVMHVDVDLEHVGPGLRGGARERRVVAGEADDEETPAGKHVMPPFRRREGRPYV
jgi:hypothetical protein